VNPRAELATEGQRHHGVPKSDRCGTFTSAVYRRLEAKKFNGLLRSILFATERLDTPALFNWLVDALSYQGMNDAVAFAYIQKHGSVTWLEIDYRLSKRPSCPKLKSYWHFHGCDYSKTSRSCSHPEYYARCQLPKYRLRNERLNQTACSLFIFLRDIADSDLLNWIDSQLSRAIFG
jgi:hypothetical protein